jgi:tRNA A-37 threonylcarbamoyl transferase component Bud32
MGSAGSDASDETLDARGGTGRSRELVAGARLGKYRLDRILGSGGMGVVWAAHDPDLERAVALKVLRYEQASAELRTRLLREARAMAKLKHPNVLTVYEVDSEGDRDFIAMELVDGASLDAWLETKPARDQIWHAILAAGRGLAAAHQAGLVHRDFKPHNVLRGNDGRVLVTDFGLARGQSDEVAPAVALETTLPATASSGLEATIDATPAPALASSSTDRTLTRTGALLGTPAYMAPEQFLGAASDPRTDQFAYCVTAWQLFAGERPFRGTTIDELRRAASAGVASVKGNLPGAIRGVLARGLDPDPAKRWPDMNALLAALERAKGRPRRRVQLALAVVGVAGAGIVAVKLATAPAKTTDSACDVTPEAEIASAWSPAHRAKLGGAGAAAVIAEELDAFATRWVADYRSACAGPRTKQTFAKLGCLLGERDIVAGFTELMPTVPQEVISQVEMGGVLPRTQACDGPSPVTPPTLPDDLVARDKIRALRPKLIASRWASPKQLLATMPDLVKQAEALGWDPLIAEAHQNFGIAALRAGEWELSRDEFKAAFDYAKRAHHDRLAAETAVFELGGEIQAASDPANATAFDDLAAQARRAAHDTGDDPHFLAQITELEAVYAVSRGKLDDAIVKYDQAHAQEATIRNFGLATRLVTDQASVLLRRDRLGDVDTAWTKLEAADGDATRAKLPPNKLFGLDTMASYVASVRGDLAAAHAWADRTGKPTPPAGAVAISGHVVDGAGKGVAGATVVAWHGVLVGDATRAYASPRFEGDTATTGSDGAFTVHGTRDGGIIAELADQRSTPRIAGDGALTLVLAPTRAAAGTVASDDEVLTGIVAIAHYALAPTLAWNCVSSVSRAHAYKLTGLPAGTATLRLVSALDPNQPDRILDFGAVDTAAPRWPTGPAIDVIVRGSTTATIWVLRDRHAVKTHADLDRLVEASHESVIHQALVIGIGDQTVEGVKQYMRGDGHGVLLANRPGEVTVCAAEAAPTAPATCKVVEIPKITPKIQDGHNGYPTIAVVLQPPPR